MIPDNVWVGRIWTLSVMSIAAQLLTTPLTLYFFKAFPVYFLPANLFVVTAAGFAAYGAVGMLVIFRVSAPWTARRLLSHGLVDGGRSCNGVLLRPSGSVSRGAYRYPRSVGLYALVISTMLVLVFKWRPALRIAGLATGCSSVVWGYRSRAVQAEERFVVYDDRHALQATMSVGRSLLVMTDDDILDPLSWTRKKLDRHQRSTGSDDPVAASFATMAGTDAVQLGPTVMGGGRWSALGIDVRFFTEITRLTGNGYDRCAGDRRLTVHQ